MTQLVARNATLEDLATLLTDQQVEKRDVIVPAKSALCYEGKLRLPVDKFQIGRFEMTEHADSQLADICGIPVRYVRKMRAEHPELLDVNFNGWLARNQKAYMFRTFYNETSGHGICRATLSDRYKRVDNLDVLTAALEGVKATGVDARVVEAQLTERRMSVRVVAPAIRVYANKLLEGYRAPFSLDDPRFKARCARYGLEPDGSPVVFAGFDIANSEIGEGAMTIIPKIIVMSCLNGQTITKDIVRNVHLGAQLGEGVVAWSDETQARNKDLVRSMTVDAVTSFLDNAYLQRRIDEIEQIAGVEVNDPQATIQVLAQKLSYTEETTAGILNHFIRGGQLTVGGILNAVTAYAQTVEDPDLEFDLEYNALVAMETAAAAA